MKLGLRNKWRNKHLAFQQVQEIVHSTLWKRSTEITIFGLREKCGRNAIFRLSWEMCKKYTSLFSWAVLYAGTKCYPVISEWGQRWNRSIILVNVTLSYTLYWRVIPYMSVWGRQWRESLLPYVWETVRKTNWKVKQNREISLAICDRISLCILTSCLAYVLQCQDFILAWIWPSEI